MIDVADDEFEADVLQRSADIPVLVDFWAPWCGPCRVLGPVLERLEAGAGGRFELAKINVDENPQAAARYGVRGIPAVKLFRDGKVVGEFVGALPEREVAAFLEEHVPDESTQRARLAAELLAAGDRDGAREAAESVLAGEPAAAAASTAHAVLARTALSAGDADAALAHARAVASSDPEWEAMQAVAEAAELGSAARAAGDPAALEARIAAAPPGEMDDVFALAIHRLLEGDHRGALDGLLALVERDRRWRDEAARRAMLTVFQLIGLRSPVSDEYRRRLAILL